LSITQILSKLPIIPPIELDPDRHFRTGHLKEDLGRRSARATAYTGGAQAVGFVLRMAATVVLARLLTPEDYGLFGMVTVLVAFISLFNDFGLSMATIQKEDVTHAEASTLFWVNIGVSSALALLLIALSPAVVWFYHEPKLLWLNVVLALSLLPGGLRVQHGAIMRRQMRFGALAVVDLTALVVGIASGITLAWLRHDYWGLAAMHWGSCLTACIGIWLVCGWWPSLPGRLATVRGQLHFGTRFTGSQVLLFMTGNLDNVLIGKFWGSGELGLYARAYQLLLMPVQQVLQPMAQVAMPALSRLQDQPDRFRRYFARALNLMAYLIVPFTLMLAALSYETILLLLGPSWIRVSTIFQALALAGLVEPFMASVGCVMIAMGRADRLLTWSLVNSPLLILSFFVGLPWGGLGVAIAYSAAKWLLIVPCFWIGLKGSSIRGIDVLRAVYRPCCLGGIVFLAASVTRWAIQDQSVLAVLGLSFAAGLFVFLVCVCLWGQARLEVLSIVEFFRRSFGSKPESSKLSSAEQIP
jgi:O-antigen/teichoic acid export membrane protein